MAAPPRKLTLRDTAVDSCARKQHAVAKGYFRDPFLQVFTADTTYINSPLMNRGYWLRVKAVENAVNRFIESLPDGAPFQIVSLGAGFDTLYLRWAAAAAAASSGSGSSDDTASSPLPGAFGRMTRFVDLDMKEVIQGKVELLQKACSRDEQGTLTGMLKKTSPADQNSLYRLVGCDMTDQDDFEKAVSEQAKLDPACPTLLLAECVFVYIPKPCSDRVLTYFLNTALKDNRHVFFFGYDAINPTDRFGQVMVSTLADRGIQLVAINDLPTPASHEQRAKQVGFTTVKSLTMKALFATVPVMDQKMLNGIEMIDDYDEWCIVHDHYAIVFACNLPVVEDADAAPKMPPIFK